MEPESGECIASAHGSRTGVAIRHPEPDGARSLLWHAQGRSTVCLPRALSLVVYRAAAGAGQDPRQPAACGRLHLAHWQAVTEDQPAGRLVDPRRMAIRRAIRHPAAAAL